MGFDLSQDFFEVCGDCLEVLSFLGDGLLVLGLLLVGPADVELGAGDLGAEAVELVFEAVDFGFLRAELDAADFHDLVLEGLDFGFEV